MSKNYNKNKAGGKQRKKLVGLSNRVDDGHRELKGYLVNVNDYDKRMAGDKRNDNRQKKMLYAVRANNNEKETTMTADGKENKRENEGTANSAEKERLMLAKEENKKGTEGTASSAEKERLMLAKEENKKGTEGTASSAEKERLMLAKEENKKGTEGTASSAEKERLMLAKEENKKGTEGTASSAEKERLMLAKEENKSEKEGTASSVEKEMLIPAKEENKNEKGGTASSAEKELLIPAKEVNNNEKGGTASSAEKELLIPAKEVNNNGKEGTASSAEKELFIPAKEVNNNGNGGTASSAEKELFIPAKEVNNNGKGGTGDGEKELMIPGDETNKLNILDNALVKYNLEKINNMQSKVTRHWPLGIIPYDFDVSSSDDILATRVREAMDLLESASCLQFRALSGRVPQNFTWIHITNPKKQRECSHRAKRQRSGEIAVVFGYDCLKRREILHGLMHAIGFDDEVTHPARDRYVRIAWENIQPKYYRLFSLCSRHKALTEYDPMSVMHFHDRAFSKNGQATVILLAPGLQIQPSDTLSQLDKMKLALAFGHECNRRTADSFLDSCKSVMQNPSETDKESDNQFDENTA